MPAEYLTLAALQADVLVAGDPAIATAAEGLVDLTDYSQHRR
ncbi:hypothetical protein [Kocuria rhizophila]|jgi:hypothetical protein